MTTVDEFLSTYPDTVRDIAFKLCDLVREVLPDAVEMVNTGHKNIVYAASDRTMQDMIAYVAPFKDSVNLGFADGIDLPDPHSLLKGTGKRLRHIKFGELDDVVRHEAATRVLLHAANAIKRDQSD